MPINTIEKAVKYSGELDKMFTQKSVVGFFADNILRAKFVGAKTVILPDIEFQGLVDYDRDNGFTRGAVTVANTPFTMQMDRQRSYQIDREDMDETGVENLAGKILGEFVRTKVTPECDAYVLSKIAGFANQNGGVSVPTSTELTKPVALFNKLAQAVREEVGYDEELVCFVDNSTYTSMLNDTTFNKQVIVSDFKKGEATQMVKSIDGVPIIPVPSTRMKGAFDFISEPAKGFVAAPDAASIRMIVMPKKGASLVKKTETLRIFTPEQNIDADAYKFDYRVYYDVFVKKSQSKAIKVAASKAYTAPDYAVNHKENINAAAASDDGAEE